MRNDNSEWLLSKGRLTGHDGFGEPVLHYIPFPEMWEKTNFNYAKGYNEKRKTIEKIFTGPGRVDTIYTMIIFHS